MNNPPPDSSLAASLSRAKVPPLLNVLVLILRSRATCLGICVGVGGAGGAGEGAITLSSRSQFYITGRCV